MKLMKNLTAITLFAAIVPLLAVGVTAFAGDKNSMRGDSEQRSGEQFMNRKPGAALYADDVIGTTVKHRGSDEDIGDIEDLIIGNSGRIVGVVIKTGGFLGLGGQNVGLVWNHLDHAMEGDELVFYVDISEDRLRNAPEYERD